MLLGQLEPFRQHAGVQPLAQVALRLPQQLASEEHRRRRAVPRDVVLCANTQEQGVSQNTPVVGHIIDPTSITYSRTQVMPPGGVCLAVKIRTIN